MENAYQTSVNAQPCRILDIASKVSGTASCCRSADTLLRMNIAPLMARRDAALDIAARLVHDGGFEKRSGCERRDGYWQISRHLYECCVTSENVLRLLSSPDTRGREQRFLNHAKMLYSLSASLANFFELRGMMLCNESAPGELDELDEHDSERISTMITGVESDLLSQLSDCFKHAHDRVLRYRSYAEKSFSADNSKRYKLSYNGYFLASSAMLRHFGINDKSESNP